MRQVCGFRVDLAAPLADGTSVTFADTSYAERLGWREIVAVGSGVSVAAADGGVLPSASVSGRLTSYPADMITRPLAQASIALVATLGGPTLPPLVIADASPIDGADIGVPGAVAGPAPGALASPVPVAGVPGGVGTGDLPSIFRSADLTPVVLLVSLLTAAALGAGHALTPGHGKTLMAAYLVGTRGRPLHALGLGLSVSVSHTVGILVLAALVLGAQGVLAPDLVVRAAPVVAAVSIVVIGGWMLFSELRRRRRVAAATAVGGHAHTHDEHEHGHEHGHDHAHEAHATRTRRRPASTATAASATATSRRPARRSPGGACSSSALPAA